MDGMIKVDAGAIGDFSSGVNTYCGELDNVAAEATNILNGISEYFTTDKASVSYAQAQQMIIDATNEGQQVIRQHGDAVDTAGHDFVAQDAASANTFYV